MTDPTVPFSPWLPLSSYVFELPDGDVRYHVSGPAALLDAVRSESPFTRDLSLNAYVADRARFFTHLLHRPVTEDVTAVAEAFVEAGAVRYLGASYRRLGSTGQKGPDEWTETATGSGWAILRRRRR